MRKISTYIKQLVVAPSSASSSKVYRCLLNQSALDDPVVTVLENTFGGTVVWTRVNDGKQVATLAGAFGIGKTMSRCSILTDDPGNASSRMFSTKVLGNDTVCIITTNIDGDSIDGVLTSNIEYALVVEIIAYP